MGSQFQKNLGKIKNEEIFSFFLIDAHRCAQVVSGESVGRLRKFGYKNAIKYKKGTPRFPDSTKCPIEKNLDKTRRPPSWISNYCVSMVMLLKRFFPLNSSLIHHL